MDTDCTEDLERWLDPFLNGLDTRRGIGWLRSGRSRGLWLLGVS